MSFSQNTNFIILYRERTLYLFEISLEDKLTYMGWLGFEDRTSNCSKDLSSVIVSDDGKTIIGAEKSIGESTVINAFKWSLQPLETMGEIWSYSLQKEYKITEEKIAFANSKGK